MGYNTEADYPELEVEANSSDLEYSALSVRLYGPVFIYWTTKKRMMFDETAFIVWIVWDVLRIREFRSAGANDLGSSVADCRGRVPHLQG